MRKQRAVEALRDAISIINGLTGDGEIDFHGTYFRYRGSLNFKPLRRIPIFLATHGPKTLQLAGEVADGVILGDFATPRTVSSALRQVDLGAKRANRNPKSIQVVSWLATAISADRVAATRAVSSIVAVGVITSRHMMSELGITLPASMQDLLNRHNWARTKTTVEAVRSLLTDEIVDAFSLAGSTDECLHKVNELAKLGVNQVGVLFRPPQGIAIEEQIEIFANKIMANVG